MPDATLVNSPPMTPHADSPVVSEKPYLTIEPSVGWSALRLAQIWRYRDLLFALATRDVKLRYRQTALGVAWVLLQPLLSAAIFAFVFGRVAKMPSDGIPYFIFAYTGLLGWSVFNSTLTKASTVVVGNAQLVSKVFFPRLILPLSTVFSTLIDFAVALGLLLVMMLFYGVAPGWGILLLPAWVALLTLFALGLGLFAAALMVSYRDLQYVVPVLLQVLLYACPVAYGLSAVPQEVRRLYLLNPLSGALEAFRWSVLGRGEPQWLNLLYSTVCGVALFFFGAYSFKKMERRFADAI